MQLIKERCDILISLILIQTHLSLSPVECDVNNYILTLEHRAIQFEFSVTWSCVSLPRYTISSDCKFMWFVKFKSQHISVFKYWRHILLSKTVYTGAYKTTEYLL